jgi:hypothetical protein
MDPVIEVIVSIDLLLGIDAGTQCTHEALRPIDLVDRLPAKIIDGWSTELQRGWHIFCYLLRPSEHNVDPSDGHKTFFDWHCICKDGSFRREYDSECHDFSAFLQKYNQDRFSQHGKRSDFVHIWTAVQTELITYRRIHENDPWISSFFNLDALQNSFQMGTEISMPLLDRSMISPYCCCGHTGNYWGLALEEDMEAYHFSNLDVRDRTLHIPLPCHYYL